MQNSWGLKGEIVADMYKNTIVVTPFGKSKETIDVSKLAADFSGHGGGDNRMVEEFVDMLLNGTEMPKSMTSLDVSIESHYVAIAAEQSRLNDGNIVLLDTLRK